MTRFIERRPIGSLAILLIAAFLLWLVIAPCEGITYEVVDIEQHPEAAGLVEQVNHGNQTVPTLVYSDGTAQTNPSLKQVQEKLASLAS